MSSRCPVRLPVGQAGQLLLRDELGPSAALQIVPNSPLKRWYGTAPFDRTRMVCLRIAFVGAVQWVQLGAGSAEL
jgi:hypothetical protein